MPATAVSDESTVNVESVFKENGFSTGDFEISSLSKSKVR